ncbi:type II secretion system protein [Vibrio fluvialis]|uniref:type II secretion system protein n=1 Tax=Vibrio fluvialis TaxID=676 RepID=UPI00399BE6C7
MKKQKGIVLFGVLIAMTIIGLLAIKASEWAAAVRIKENANSFYNRVLYIQQQFHAYISDKYLTGTNINSSFIFPYKFSDLEGNYIPACSVDDNNAGFCMRYNQTPWGDIAPSDYRVVQVNHSGAPTYYRAELDITLPDKNNAAFTAERNMTLSMFSQLSNIRYDDANNKITLLIDRPDKAFAYDSLVKRSGDDSELLGDWDIGGNYALTNAKDYTIRNADGTQKTVANKLTEIYTVKHGDYLTKPSCPTGMAFSYNLSISGIDSAAGYTLTGSNRPYLLSETSSEIRVGLDIIAERNSDNAKVMLHTGYVTVFMQCT